MGDCKNHKKDVLGIEDMKVLAEMVGDLHYQTLSEFLYSLSSKIQSDASKDRKAGRIQLALKLWAAKNSIEDGFVSINEAWKISEPFMEEKIK